MLVEFIAQPIDWYYHDDAAAPQLIAFEAHVTDNNSPEVLKLDIRIFLRPTNHKQWRVSTADWSTY